jgi:hypothetical protein
LGICAGFLSFSCTIFPAGWKGGDHAEERGGDQHPTVLAPQEQDAALVSEVESIRSSMCHIQLSERLAPATWPVNCVCL